MGKKKRKIRKGYRWVVFFLFLVMGCYWGNQVLIGVLENNILPVFSSKSTSRDQVLKELEALRDQDDRIQRIVEHMDDYPLSLLEMLSRDLDLLDFVVDFPLKKGHIYSESVGDVVLGEMPLLLQWDSRWGYASYGENYVAISGCAPTSLAMVIVSLTGDDSVTPYVVAHYAEEAGYYAKGIGTSWSLMTEGSSHFGVVGTVLSLDKERIYQILEMGYPIICSMRPGDFTSVGHFIVLAGVRDGKIVVRDPNSKKRSQLLWDYDVLAPQIKNLWYFRKK